MAVSRGGRVASNNVHAMVESATAVVRTNMERRDFFLSAFQLFRLSFSCCGFCSSLSDESKSACLGYLGVVFFVHFDKVGVVVFSPFGYRFAINILFFCTRNTGTTAMKYYTFVFAFFYKRYPEG